MKYKNKILLFTAGSSYALAFPFAGKFTLFPLIFFAAAIFIKSYLGHDRSLKEKLLDNLVFLWGFNSIGFYWLNFTLFEFGGLTPPFNIIFWQLFTLIIGLHFLLFTVLAHYTFKKLNTFQRILSICLVFPLFEYFMPQQFPAHFGHPWLVLAPYIYPAQIFGVPFFSFLSLLFGGTFLYMFLQKKFSLKIVSLIVGTILILFIYPIRDKILDEKLKIKIVQANIGNDLKLKSEQGFQMAVDQVVETYHELSKKDLKEDTDLIIWPETAYPRVLGTKYNSKAPLELSRILQDLNTNLLIGTYDLSHMRQTSFEQQYNSAMAFSSTGELLDVYHKKVLIPFGEGLPFGRFNEYFAPYISNISFFAKGEKFTNFKIKNFSYISLICYEVLFPRFVREYLNKHDNINFIVNLTNDSWYGPYAEQEQHLFLAKWRSVEFNLPLVRATNTGITSIIYPSGKELARTKNFEQTALDITLDKLEESITPYQRYGIMNYIFFMLIVGLASFLRRKSLFKKIMHS